MVELSNGVNEEVVVTITEKITLTNPYIIFVFENDSTFDKRACLVGDNISTETQRYDKFVITVKTSPNTSNGEVNLQRGDGKYWVYEVASVSGIDYDNIDTSSMNELENGKYRYNLVSTTDSVYKTVPPVASIYNE